MEIREIQCYLLFSTYMYMQDLSLVAQAHYYIKGFQPYVVVALFCFLLLFLYCSQWYSGYSN